jgi:FkbM family methyltransferase
MNGFLQNCRTILKRPGIGLQYAIWVFQSVMHHKPVRRLHGVKLSEFSDFSEYHSVAGGVSIEELAFIENYPFGDGAMLDVGANLGLFALLMNRRFPDRTIFAFEPNPSTFAALQRNVARNGAELVECHPVAVADYVGVVNFAVLESARANASISSETSALADGCISVNCTTLDQFCLQHDIRRIALLKVDVEGFEWLVFKGGATVLQDVRPGVIYFEVCPDLTKAAGFDITHPAYHLVEQGYALYRLPASGELQPVAAKDAVSIDAVENWVAIDIR